jgi:hypothetical protein
LSAVVRLVRAAVWKAQNNQKSKDAG